MSQMLSKNIDYRFNLTRDFLRRDGNAWWCSYFMIWFSSRSVLYQTFGFCATIDFLNLNWYGPILTVEKGVEISILIVKILGIEKFL